LNGHRNQTETKPKPNRNQQSEADQFQIIRMTMFKNFKCPVPLKVFLSAGGLSAIWFGGKVVLETPWARSRRIMNKATSDIKLMAENFPFVMKEELAEDLTKAMTVVRGGVNILWAPQGAGKTTTVQKVCEKLKKEGKILGAVIMQPPDGNADPPHKWFRMCLSDAFGALLLENEKLSDLMPYSKGHPPVVFVFDQMDNVKTTDELKCFIKTLAEDSTLVKSYVVIVILHDADIAHSMREWNGRQKIVILSDHDVFRYKWNENDISEWLKNYSRTIFLEDDDFQRTQFITYASKAGTPGFLYNYAEKAENFSKYENDIAQSAKYYDTLWSSGKSSIDRS
jgi:hypothetical protein